MRDNLSTADPRSNSSFVSLIIHSYKKNVSVSLILGMALEPEHTGVN